MLILLSSFYYTPSLHLQIDSMSLHGLDPEHKKAKVLEIAQHEGLRAATISGALSSASVFAAHHFSPWFQKRTNVSIRVALIISPPALLYFLVSEQTMIQASRDPDRYGIYPEGHVAAPKKLEVNTLAWHHHLANAAYKSPFATILAVGVPVIGSIFYQQSKTHPG
jgi:Early nodulin 93 ENOD93 protein